MIWVGSFQSLRSVLPEPRSTHAPLAVHTWLRSELDLISPLVDWLMSLIAASQYLTGKEESVELALREALSNAMLHGNRLAPLKLVHVRCCCECGKRITIIVRDQGHGFDPKAVPDPLASENLGAERGRGIHLMKTAMDEISFAHGGTEVYMRKAGRKRGTPAWRSHNEAARPLVSRPSPGVRVVELH